MAGAAVAGAAVVAVASRTEAAGGGGAGKLLRRSRSFERPTVGKLRRATSFERPSRAAASAASAEGAGGVGGVGGAEGAGVGTALLQERALLQGRLAELETSRSRARLEAEGLRAHLAALQQQQQQQQQQQGGGGGGEVRPGGEPGCVERGGARPASRHAEELRRRTEENEQLAASLLRQAQDRQRHRDVVARLTLTRTLLP
jgi:hypothetical protein